MFQASLPRIRLALLPSPLEEAPRFSEAVGGPRVFLKRDDYTGLGLGGNKLRKLEFLIADALRSEADVVVTAGGPQSNHARLTAAAARKVGLDCCLVLIADRSPPTQGNLLLNAAMGADVRFRGARTMAEVPLALEAVVEELRAEGRRPYMVPVGGACPLGAVGYAYAGVELAQQLCELGIEPSAVIVSAGSCGTFAGLTVAQRALHLPFRVIGISVNRPRAEVQERTARLASECAALLGLAVEVRPDEVEAYDEYVGPGYAVPTAGCLEAIQMAAQTEGTFLDPVYTGKGMAGLIDLVRSGRLSRSEPVVFLHTGGTPALFAYSGEVEAFLRASRIPA